MGTLSTKAPLYRFTALDGLAIAVYVGFTAYFLLAGETLNSLMLQLFDNPATASYAVNAIFYAGVGIFAVASAWRVAGRDLKILGTRPWFTLGMVPLAIVVMLILTALLVAAFGSVQSSENQLGIQGMLQQVPAWLMVPLLVILGPFVEEYLFRHLLIGKLSQHLNIWICCVISVVVFASIHVVGREGLALPALAPYLGMAVVLVAVYVWTGKNLMFSYFVHATKNLMAVVLIYAVPPELLPN
ncbi:CPBP family intramembrane metalloprotease [Arthrobacter sp. MYb23]|uniref:CPBP family intramembrane glutamic endopeptidase n=1 Tax=unclassified Arthrobacter TaxID=235627 RepID=UPI000CFD8833|nr:MULTISPECIES: CPBP family intramembrane glutamic endopeptidase [unclassified Arthrobacter]PRB44925.1 CPBP family intramembrane metalloprotease [Arthrobacter sp. MYb51]PRB99612.1 CPBP family intramembrane metalloprotease [Arthrobacter sp. MYb23]